MCFSECFMLWCLHVLCKRLSWFFVFLDYNISWACVLLWSLFLILYMWISYLRFILNFSFRFTWMFTCDLSILMFLTCRFLHGFLLVSRYFLLVDVCCFCCSARSQHLIVQSTTRSEPLSPGCWLGFLLLVVFATWLGFSSSKHFDQ